MREQNHRSTSRVLDIFELLSLSENGLTLTELAAKLDAPKSSIFPIIHTMEERQFVKCDVTTNKYKIGHKAYLTGGTFESEKPIFEYIKCQMKEVADNCNETCNLGILVGSLVTYAAICESRNPFGYRAYVGVRFPAYCSGIGKALLLYKTKEELMELYPEGLKKYTENTITSFDELYAQLQEAKEEGFTYESEEAREEIFCIAIALCNGDNSVAAISVSIPLYRATDDKISLVKENLKRVKMNTEQYLKKFNIVDGWEIV